MWCTSAPSVTARKAELVNVVLTLEWYCVPVYQVSMSGTLTQPSYRHKQVLLPEAICCFLQT